MFKRNDTVLTKKNSLCKFLCQRQGFAILQGIGSGERILAKVKDLRSLKPFHGINVIV
jgi:hypothetical protein